MGDLGDDPRLLHLKLNAAMIILERLGFHVCGSDREKFMQEVEKLKKEWDGDLAKSHLTPSERLKEMFTKGPAE